MISSVFDSYQLNISILGQIHIGTGHDLEPTNYVIKNNKLYEFPIDALIATLSAEDRKELLSIVSNANSPAVVRQVQQLLRNHSSQLMAHAYPPVHVSPGVAQLYYDRTAPKSRHHNALEIQRTYRNPLTRVPVLPGSSIKGAMRTALLNQLHQGKQLPNRERTPRNAARDLERRLFRYQDFHQDPMRLIHVGDTEITQPHPPRTSIVFAVNRKKRAVQHRGQEVRSMAEKGNLYQMLEVVSDQQVRVFSSDLILQKIDPDWAKQDAVRKHVPDPQLHFTVEQIALACNAFYLPLLEQELTLLRERGFVGKKWDNIATQFQKIVEQQQTSGFLLRIGHHSGAEAVTLDGARDIRIMQGKGKKPRFAEASETLWLAASQQDARTNLIPFGWIVVGLTKIA